jgi:cytochrome P450
MDSANNFLTFHRDEARHQYFSTREGRDVFFDSRIKTWIVTDPSHYRQLIGSDNLRPASYAEDYRALSRRFDIDFSGLVFAFSHIPLCLHGDDHARFRRKASEFLAGRRAAVAPRIPELTARHFRAFNRLGKIEVMREVLEPLAHEYIGLIAGIEIDAAHCDQASQIFDRSSGLNKRIAMEAEIALLRELVASRLDKSATEEEVGLRLAYIILGKDPLKGTLGESLRKIFESNAGSKLSDIDFPEYPPETGVPFIERLVLETFNFGAHEFKRGDRVRIFLQSLAYDFTLSRSNFFGAGPHACLGRPLSIELWNGIATFLSGLPLRATVLSYAPRTSDYVFTCPDTLLLEMSS